MIKFSGISCRLTVFLLVLLTLSSCVENYRPLSIEDQQRMVTSDVYVFIKQQEINAMIKQSNMAAGGGLLFAIADAAINNHLAKEQEAYIRPIRDSLIGFNFGTALTDAFGRQMQSAGWPQIRNVIFTNEFSKEKLASVVAGSSADSVLFLDAAYVFVPDFNRLKISTAASIYLKTSAKPDPDIKPAYLNSAIFFAAPEKKDMSKEEAVQYWSADNAARTRASLEKGVGVLAKMISYDLKSDRAAEDKLETSDLDPIYPDVRVISKEDDCLMTRLPINILKSVCGVK